MGQLIHVDYIEVCSYVLAREISMRIYKLVGLCEKSEGHIFWQTDY